MTPVSLGDTVYLHVGTSSASTGAATNADSTPTVTVEEDGAALGYAPTVANVATGLYRVTIDCTGGNGFEAGRRYSVYVAATVGGITGRDGIGEYEVLAVDLNTALDAAISSRLASASYTAPDNASITTILSDTNDIQTRLPAALISGRMDSNAQVVGDKTGYSLIQTFPANFASLSITAGGLVDITQTAADKVWGTSTRILTAGTNIALAKGTGVTGFNDIAAADVWASATRTLTAFSFSVTVGTNSDKTGYDLSSSARDAIANAALDLADAIETGLTQRQALRLVASALAGKISGASGTTVTIRNAVADTKDRIVATVDGDGNRSAITYDMTG